MTDVVIPEDIKFVPTEEQINIIRKAIECDNMKIDALAGSSKTTTLVLVAHNLVVKSLYLAFNKNMAEEAKSKFPAHVEVRTSHSLAYREIGNEYQHKLTRPRGEYRNVLGTGSEIARFFRIAPMLAGEKSVTSAAIGFAIKSTVSNFEYSADKEISEKHVSMSEVQQHLGNKGFKEKEFRQRVLKFAKKLWEKRVDLNDETLITHDTYMKLFQLSEPDLSEYEVIYLDEAQDTNPCLIDIFTRQTKSKLIAVGDNLQSIYGFRKAVNALASLKWVECKLTKSFRFGQDLADIANGVALDEDMKVMIHMTGNEAKHTEVVEELPSNINKHICYIYRTNAAMLEKALELIEKGERVAVHVDVADFVAKVESVEALAKGEIKKVKHADIVIYSNWTELVSEAEHIKGELARIVKMVSRNEHHRVLNLLRNYKPVSNPDVILITAHKSKGLEFDNVVLGDDFETLFINEQTNKLQFVNLQERNLLYVACTRAKEVFVMSNLVKEILDINNRWCDNDDSLSFDVAGGSPSRIPDLERDIKLVTAQEFGYVSHGTTDELAEFAMGSWREAASGFDEDDNNHWSAMRPNG